LRAANAFARRAIFTLCADRTGEFAANRTKIDLVAPQTGYDVLLFSRQPIVRLSPKMPHSSLKPSRAGSTGDPPPARSFAHFAW